MTYINCMVSHFLSPLEHVHGAERQTEFISNVLAIVKNVTDAI